MKEGTKSWLFGCHSIVHSYYVFKAWKVLYGSYPNFMETICILLHDIGYIGIDYLSNKSNKGHAILGAKIAKFLFGEAGWNLVIGHSRADSKANNVPLSPLEGPDDYSWLLAPDWWLDFNRFIEPQLAGRAWKKKVKDNWESGKRVGGMELGFYGRDNN
jgi:hypothetical protein